MQKLKAGKAEPLTQVPVTIGASGGKITCDPYTVKLYKGEEVEWHYPPGGHMIEFETIHPFGKRRHHAKGVPHVRSGPHHCSERKDFKYTITVPGVEPLDPVVDADPRRRPTKP